MRSLVVVSALAVLAGSGVARARSHGHHPQRVHHRPLRVGPSEAELKNALEALRVGDPRLCTLAVDRLSDGGWERGRQRLDGEDAPPVLARGPVKAPGALPRSRR